MERFVYGTAWKEDDTARLVRQALDAGFRAIDTANQRKHYHEAGVGDALAKAYADGIVTRQDVWLQSKFTSVDGQDHRLPYDAHADPATQVAQSMESSLTHLHTDALDSYVLHGPTTRQGWAPYDQKVWRAMETQHDEHKTRRLGVSNVSLQQLALLWDLARIKPAFVQNRCYAKTGWDRQTRAFCNEHGIVYQGFSLLTANRAELQRPAVAALAKKHEQTAAQIAFRFALAVGMMPLTGSSRAAHLHEDLACTPLAADDVDAFLHATA